MRAVLSAAVVLSACAVATEWQLAQSAPVDVSTFNVEWLTETSEPGHNEKNQPTYMGGMPVGNGDMTAYVWANVSAGGVQMYLQKSDAMSR